MLQRNDFLAINWLQTIRNQFNDKIFYIIFIVVAIIIIVVLVVIALHLVIVIVVVKIVIVYICKFFSHSFGINLTFGLKAIVLGKKQKKTSHTYIHTHINVIEYFNCYLEFLFA